MRRVTLIVALVTLLGIGLTTATACDSSGSALELTQAHDMSEQVVSLGQEMRIGLEANPTTGYQWAIDGQMPRQLEQMEEPEYSATSEALGAGGIETWTFVGSESGEGVLKLKYWRSFEPDVAPIETFSVSVTVK